MRYAFRDRAWAGKYVRELLASTRVDAPRALWGSLCVTGLALLVLTAILLLTRFDHRIVLEGSGFSVCSADTGQGDEPMSLDFQRVTWVIRVKAGRDLFSAVHAGQAVVIAIADGDGELRHIRGTIATSTPSGRPSAYGAREDLPPGAAMRTLEVSADTAVACGEPLPVTLTLVTTSKPLFSWIFS